MPASDGELIISEELPEGELPRLKVMYHPPATGHLRLVSIFLFDEWVGAEARLVEQAGRHVLELSQCDDQMVLPLPEMN